MRIDFYRSYGSAGPSSGSALGQQGYDPAARIAAQKEAMAKLSAVSGEWRGPARTLHALTGPGMRSRRQSAWGLMLDGVLREIEGRGYEADGKLSFNALGVISYNPDTRRHTPSIRMRWVSRAIFPGWSRATGFAWETPGGSWHDHPLRHHDQGWCLA